MSFLAVLLALLLEQIKPLPRGNVVHDALTGWIAGVTRNFDAGKEHHAWIVWSITVLVPTVACVAAYLALVQFRLGLAFDVAVLYLTLGFRQFSHYFTDIRAALERGDEIEARRLLAEWRHLDASELPPSEFLRHLIEHSLLAAHRHVFGVFFWFVLLSTLGLGPAGAVLYRLAEFVSRYWSYRSGSAGIAVNERLGELALRLFRMLDHVPARMTASGFAVVGNFEEAVNCWRRDASLWRYDNEGVILAAAAGRGRHPARRRLGAGAHSRSHQDVRSRRAAGLGGGRRVDSGRDPAARPPALDRRARLALGRALDAVARAALARQPDRLGRTAQLAEDLGVDAVARRRDLAAFERGEHPAAGLVQVGAVVEAARVACAAMSGISAASLPASMWRRPNSWNPGESISALVRSASIQCHSVVVVVWRPVFSAFEISAVCARASGAIRLTSVLLPAPLGPRTSVARPARSGARRACASARSGFNATSTTRYPSPRTARGARAQRRTPAGRAC
jgi:adenosylcobinamide-phosphate synthase